MAIAPNKRGPLTARASAALLAAGAYDVAATATAVQVDECRDVELFVSYTRGGAGGSCKVKVLASDDGVSYYERTVIDGASLSGGTMNVFTAQLQLPVAAGASAELRTLQVPCGGCGWLKFLFAEVGNTGAPGTVAATVVAVT